MRISVAMAVYHGEAYLDAQLSSILSQLEPEDEIIVSDDCPGGKTEEIVRRFAEQDQRVHYVQGPGRGLIANFGHAISLCGGDAIFLSDQDDVWMPVKANKVKAALEAGALLVLHDACVTDADMHPLEPSFFCCSRIKARFWGQFDSQFLYGLLYGFSQRALRGDSTAPGGHPYARSMDRSDCN